MRRHGRTEGPARHPAADSVSSTSESGGPAGGRRASRQGASVLGLWAWRGSASCGPCRLGASLDSRGSRPVVRGDGAPTGLPEERIPIHATRGPPQDGRHWPRPSRGARKGPAGSADPFPGGQRAAARGHDGLLSPPGREQIHSADARTGLPGARQSTRICSPRGGTGSAHPLQPRWSCDAPVHGAPAGHRSGRVEGGPAGGVVRPVLQASVRGRGARTDTPPVLHSVGQHRGTGQRAQARRQGAGTAGARVAGAEEWARPVEQEGCCQCEESSQARTGVSPFPAGRAQGPVGRSS